MCVTLVHIKIIIIPAKRKSLQKQLNKYEMNNIFIHIEINKCKFENICIIQSLNCISVYMMNLKS